MLPIIAGALLIGVGKYVSEWVISSADKPAIALSKRSDSPTNQENKIISLDKPEIVESDQDKLRELTEVEQTLIASYVSVGLLVAGAIYPLLTYGGVIILASIAVRDTFKAYKIWTSEKKIGFEFLDAVAVSGLLLTEHFVITSMIMVIFYTGRHLLLKAQGHNKQTLTGIFEHQQSFAWVVKDGIEIETSLNSLERGDIVSIRAGESILADGTIIIGHALIDQKILTGESQPVEKGPGDHVLASTFLVSGKISIRVEKSGKETVAANIEEIWKQTIDFKTSVQSKGEKIAKQTVVPTLALGAAALPIIGFSGSLGVLYSYVGYDISLFAPLSMLNFMKASAKNDILIKDGRAMELLRNVDTIVFDKTGTLTSTQPSVSRIHAFDGYAERDILQYAAIAENRQTHPIAKAIMSKAETYTFTDFTIDDIHYEVGYGIRIRIGNDLIRVGSARFMKMEGITISAEIEKVIFDCYEQGYALVMVAKNNLIVGAIELHNAIRPEVYSIIQKLKRRNKDIYIISGDYEHIVKIMAQELDIEKYFAEVFPEQKSLIIEQLQQQGRKICFIGDGINDSIAMKVANVSISLHGASQVATDTADIILMDGTLKNVDELFNLAEDIDKNLQIAMKSAIIPGVFNIGAAFFMGAGVVGSIAVDMAGLTIGVANGFLPLLRKSSTTATIQQK